MEEYRLEDSDHEAADNYDLNQQEEVENCGEEETDHNLDGAAPDIANHELVTAESSTQKPVRQRTRPCVVQKR
ncbi:unnamed protein product [Arabis nemorensis]|uniref:Uncharacterized protein n=1 Tax=Arabis nemorensis TaxID=586526 RepID=A0A565BSH3_9BRAS|nr:unnamed protein product [Arabis nemorensis]